MAMANRCILLAVLVGWLGTMTAPAQATAEARITGIKATTDVVVANSTFQSLEGRRLSKFVPEGRQVPRAVLVVDWQTVRALPSGCVMKFSYRRPGSDAVRHLEQRYTRAVTGRQQTTFAVNMDDPARDRVAAWRVQLLHQDQVLDEQRSAAWGN
jgi:hypothetical protein